MNGLILLGMLTAICWAASHYGGKGGAGFLFVVWGLALLVLLISPPVAWVFVLGFAVLMAVLASTAVKSRRVALVFLLATTFVGLACGAIWYTRYRELAGLSDAYPAVSISELLAYEARGQRRSERDAPDYSATDANGEDHQLPPPISGELVRLEERLDNWNTPDYWRLPRRKRALARLSSIHERMVSEFSIALGFGVSRMSPGNVHREDVEIPELPYLAVPEIPELAYGETSSEINVGPERMGQDPIGQGEIAQAENENRVSPDRETLRDVHEVGVADFSNREGFGFVASREKVFGFQSHGFRNQPQLPGSGNTSSRWRIASLELVSLLKHEVPAAYVSQNLPRMDELANAPTRSLDTFETAALGQLRSGEEIVVEENAGELRMLGSLRAAKQCIECHSVSRGDLLGAFTYRLRRDDPVRNRPVAAAKPVL
jgi:hypothetical protein